MCKNWTRKSLALLAYGANYFKTLVWNVNYTAIRRDSNSFGQQSHVMLEK